MNREMCIPYAAKPKQAALECAGLFAAFAALLGYTWFVRSLHPLVLIVQGLLSAVLWFPTLIRCIARLYLRPERITLAVFGLEYRRISAQKIKLLTGVRYSHKFDTMVRLAVCDRSFEELVECERKNWDEYTWKNTPMSEEDYVHKYLSRRAHFNLFRDLNLSRDILWLDWDPERVTLLLRMYPNAVWKDCSPEQEFDECMKV